MISSKALSIRRVLSICGKIACRTAAVLFLGLILPVLWGYTRSESYCFFNPSIDTHYAAGFSEEAFSQVTTGMTKQAVQQKLGAPLWQHATKDGKEWWGYTSDGKCTWGDWAWLGRHIILQDGKVCEVVKRVFYD